MIFFFKVPLSHNAAVSYGALNWFRYTLLVYLVNGIKCRFLFSSFIMMQDAIPNFPSLFIYLFIWLPFIIWSGSAFDFPIPVFILSFLLRYQETFLILPEGSIQWPRLILRGRRVPLTSHIFCLCILSFCLFPGSSPPTHYTIVHKENFYVIGCFVGSLCVCV